MNPQFHKLLRKLPLSRQVYLSERQEMTGAIHELQQQQQASHSDFWLYQLQVQKEFAKVRDELAALQTQVDHLRWQVRIRDSVLAPAVPSLAPHEPDYDIDKCFQKLAAIAPRAYALWRPLLDVNATAYEGLPADSCSVRNHAIAERFRLFLQPYLRGPVLDVGCGPQPVPWYLEGYPAQLIAGLDPLPASTPHPFSFVWGVAEYLPWRDHTFQAVIASTSLDHVLYLDRALAEIRRVLKPGGHFITWVGFIKGAPPYDPYGAEVRQVDPYHLFHFDRPFFERALAEHFLLEEVVDVDALSFFWSFRPRPAMQQ